MGKGGWNAYPMLAVFEVDDYVCGIVFFVEKRFESVEGDVSEDVLMVGDGVQRTAQSDCLNQGMCDKEGR